MNIYVGNLSSEVSGEDLKQAFEAFGKVDSAAVIKDKFTGLSRGFGFVEMGTDSEAQAAISGLNGKELKGKVLKVNEARPREQGRGNRGRSGRDRGGFGRDRGGFGRDRGDRSRRGGGGGGRHSW